MRHAALLLTILLGACNPLNTPPLSIGAAPDPYVGLGTVPRPVVPGPEPVPGPDYRAIERAMRAKGLLRLDENPADAPFGGADLVRNFERIALRAEGEAGTRRGAATVERGLRRFGPVVTYAVIGEGASAADRDAVDRLMQRIAWNTGLQIRRDELQPLVQVYMLPRREIPDTARALDWQFPGVDRIADTWALSPDWLCVALSGPDPRDPGRLGAAAIFIPDEAEGRLRLSCLHEEIVQSFGLPNDDDRVRPSIFNDDEEFALMTSHDELLLRILYHPRLAPGMTREQAMARVPGIVADLRPGG